MQEKCQYANPQKYQEKIIICEVNEEIKMQKALIKIWGTQTFSDFISSAVEFSEGKFLLKLPHAL